MDPETGHALPPARCASPSLVDLPREPEASTRCSAPSMDLPPVRMHDMPPAYDTVEPPVMATPVALVPFEVEGPECELNPLQRRSLKSLSLYGGLLILFSIVSMITPVQLFMPPIEVIFNLTVASMVLHWVKPHNAQRILSLSGARCCGFRHIYGLSVASAVITSLCLSIRLVMSVLVFEMTFTRRSLAGFYILSCWSSLLCVLLLSFIASVSAPTTGHVSLTRPGAALISLKQQARETVNGRPPANCCAQSVSRCICWFFMAVALGGSAFFIFERARFAGSNYNGYGYQGGGRYYYGYMQLSECAMDAMPFPNATQCECLDTVAAATLGLLCTGQTRTGCIESSSLLCPSSYSMSTSNGLIPPDSAIEASWLPTCFVLRSCNASDIVPGPDYLGLVQRPCQFNLAACSKPRLVSYSE